MAEKMTTEELAVKVMNDFNEYYASNDYPIRVNGVMIVPKVVYEQAIDFLLRLGTEKAVESIDTDSLIEEIEDFYKENNDNQDCS